MKFDFDIVRRIIFGLGGAIGLILILSGLLVKMILRNAILFIIIGIFLVWVTYKYK